MSKYAIEAENITISYRTVKSINYRELFKFSKKVFSNKKFDAVKNASFKIKKGEVVGIVGENGSGKSTLLKAIAGLFSVDNGELILSNDRVSLLALGVGFQSKLSGYENIILSGLAMGFKREEILSKIDDIIAFSELGDHIFKPVKNYSSGMYSKLAFSISVFLIADIILIDEVLSVGDMSFRKKSLDKIKEIILDDSKTVVIVSHSEDMIEKMCSSVLWIHNGEIKMYDTTKKVLSEYINFMEKK